MGFSIVAFRTPVRAPAPPNEVAPDGPDVPPDGVENTTSTTTSTSTSTTTPAESECHCLYVRPPPTRTTRAQACESLRRGSASGAGEGTRLPFLAACEALFEIFTSRAYESSHPQ